MPKFAKNEFQTDLLWMLIHDKENLKINNSAELDMLISTLFPGIKFIYMYKFSILIKYCTPSVVKQLPGLCSAPSAEIAKKQFGNTLMVKKEKECNGYEWVDWESARS